MLKLNLALVALLGMLVPLCAGAADLPKPTGKVILTVSGNIANTNSGDVAEFDIEMLDRIASRSTVTKTPWYDGPRTFSGPLLSALMETVGARAEAITVRAINDYSADIPMTDIQNIPLVLATRIDGKELSIRDKGPTFVIYPFDEMPELFNELYFGRSVWQINAIEVK